VQTKKWSMIETLVSVGIGWIISVILNMLVLPLFDYDVNLTDGVLISIIFTAVSVVRSYVVRRFFNSRSK
jgi:TctA family transporter